MKVQKVLLEVALVYRSEPTEPVLIHLLQVLQLPLTELELHLAKLHLFSTRQLKTVWVMMLLM